MTTACTNSQPLHQSQRDMSSRIKAAGAARGFSAEEIAYALKAAFIESSLGDAMAARAGTSHIGLYQYDPVTWKALGHAGSITSVDAQITAFYNDMSKYTARYEALAPADRGFLSLEQYSYLKHHDGNNYTNWSGSPGVKIFNQTCFEPDKAVDNTGGNVYSGMTDWDIYNFQMNQWFNRIETVGIVTVGPLITHPPEPTDDGDGGY